MRKFPPQLPGLFELNRNASGQQATPLAVPPAVRPPPPPPNTSGVSSVKSTANGASTNFHSQQAEQQRRAPDIEKSTVAATNTQANGAAIDEGLKSQRDNSKQFIMAWHDSGYTFDQLVAEGLDPTFLSGLYRELSLPIPSSDQRPAAPTRGPQATVVSKQQALPPKPPSIAQPTLPPINTQKSNAVPAAAQAHVSKPVDHLGGQSPAGAAEKAGSPAVGRQDYIARLMAAKTKKANAASPTSRDQTPMDAGRPNPSTRPAAIVSSDPPSIVAAPQQTAQPSVTVARPIDASTKPQITQNIENASRPAPPQRVPSASEQAMAEAKKKAQTALAKERMAALARNKASKNAPMPTVPTLPPRADGIAATNGAPVIRTTAQSTLPVQTQPATHRSSLSTSATPAPPVHQRATPVSRIPGLSTLSPQIEALPDKSGANLLLPQKPVATILRPASESKPASARLIKSEGPQATDTVFGQGPQPGAVAPVVIELSDDEDDAPKTAKRATKDLAPPKPIGEKATATPSPSISTSKKPAELKSQVSAPESSESSVVLQNPNATTDQVQNPQQLRSLEIRKRLAELELRRKQKAQENKPQGPTSVVKPTSGKPPASSQLGDRIAEAATNAKDTDTPPPAKKLKTNAQDTVEQMSNELQPPNADDSADPQSQDNISSASKPLAESNSMRQDHPRSLSKEPGRTLSAVDHGKGESTPASTPNPKAINPKSRRRTEIQTKLPAIEASFANNTSRLEVLRAQMREIEESLKREQEDRDKLVAELESLGVDTEGMDHAELRETRDEIMAQAPTDDDVMDRGENA